ncbi:PRC-barrel domain-containing protein [Patescibacteria group bacterium]|nr:PRC-barrel domain-containing protein [Patescibacteria group bacterium]
MKLYLSDIIGIPIISHHTEQKIGKVAGSIFDPETGKLLALNLRPDAQKIITAADIMHVYRTEVTVMDDNSISPLDEVLRVKVVYNSGIRFLGNRVHTEHNDYLGKVIDIQIDTVGLFLSSLVIAKSFLVFTGDKRIVSKKDIIEVNKDKIIVKKSSLLKKEKVKEFVNAPI